MTISSLERHDEAVRLREAGLTYAEIGRRWGISKQRARVIVKGKPRRRDKPSLDSKVMLAPRDVALLLGIHANTVRRWSEKGILIGYRICGRGDRRFRREDIDRFLKERQIGSEESLGKEVSHEGNCSFR